LPEYPHGLIDGLCRIKSFVAWHSHSSLSSW